MKNNCALFSRLYIALQIHNGDLDEFFRHENQASPPALSQMGVFRTGNKHCLQDLASEENTSTPTVQATILDGAAIVNMLQPGCAKTFHDYATDYHTSSTCQQVRRRVG